MDIREWRFNMFPRVLVQGVTAVVDSLSRFTLLQALLRMLALPMILL